MQHITQNLTKCCEGDRMSFITFGELLRKYLSCHSYLGKSSMLYLFYKRIKRIIEK